MTTLVTLQDLSAEQIRVRAESLGEPAWLAERRVQAWEFFAQAGPPEWRRTDLSGLDAAGLNPTDEMVVQVVS